MAGGSDQRVTGKFLDIYKPDEAGSWKIHVTMFNFDAPDLAIKPSIRVGS